MYKLVEHLCKIKRYYQPINILIFAPHESDKQKNNLSWDFESKTGNKENLGHESLSSVSLFHKEERVKSLGSSTKKLINQLIYYVSGRIRNF